jgi:hypothetical protein
MAETNAVFVAGGGGAVKGQMMEVTKTQRGFQLIDWPSYSEKPVAERLAQQSSAVGEYADAMDRPGSSFLWIGDKHHLNREEVADLIRHLQAWVKTGTLEL